MEFSALLWIDGLWIVFLVVWVVAAGKTKRTARRMSGWQRYLQISFAIPGVILLFGKGLRFAGLGYRLIPMIAALAWFGVALTACGIAFAAWARFALGGNWSSEITVKEGHELVRSGPYRFVRHPIYSGVLLALFGTAVCIGEIRAAVAFVLFLAGFWVKARTEEALMVAQFGEQYRRYQREVKALIPFVL